MSTVDPLLARSAPPASPAPSVRPASGSVDPLLAGSARRARPARPRPGESPPDESPPDVPPIAVQAATEVASIDISGGFHDFYVRARPAVGRALALTLRDADLAADAVDEAFVRAYQRWERVGSLDNPEGWVYRVGLNHARSRLRRLLRRPPPSATGPATTELVVTDPAIERALGVLSVDQRAVVVCRHLLGWSEAQTAAALDIRPGTVKSRLARALTRLESELHHLRPEDRS